MHHEVCFSLQRVEIVLTAHPTQVNRRTLQYKHTRIATLLAQNDRHVFVVLNLQAMSGSGYNVCLRVVFNASLLCYTLMPHGCLWHHVIIRYWVHAEATKWLSICSNACTSSRCSLAAMLRAQSQQNSTKVCLCTQA